MTTTPATAYAVGQAVFFDEAPAVVLEADNERGTLTVARHAGISSYIGTRHSGLAPLDESSIWPFQAERIAEIRAYYGMSAERWHIRRDGRSVAYVGSAVDALAWLHRHHSYSAAQAVAHEGYTITADNGDTLEV